MTPDPGTTEASPEDVAEQQAALTDDVLDAPPLDVPDNVPDDVPYADAVEQAQAVSDDEDGPRE